MNFIVFKKLIKYIMHYYTIHTHSCINNTKSNDNNITTRKIFDCDLGLWKWNKELFWIFFIRFKILNKYEINAYFNQLPTLSSGKVPNLKLKVANFLNFKNIYKNLNFFN